MHNKISLPFVGRLVDRRAKVRIATEDGDEDVYVGRLTVSGDHLMFDRGGRLHMYIFDPRAIKDDPKDFYVDCTQLVQVL